MPGTSLCEFHCYLNLPYSTVIFTYLHMFNSRYVTATIILFIGSRQKSVSLRHSYRQPTVTNVCFDTVCSVCCRYFSLLLWRLCHFLSGPATFTSLCRQLPLHLFAPVAFCNQACLPLPTATPVHSRPPPIHSLTHSLTDHPLLCSTSTITTCSRIL